MQDHQIRAKIHPKQHVRIAVKKDGRYSPELQEGIVADILTNTAEHYRGIKVRLTDGTVGRVQEIVKIRKTK